MTSKHDSVLDAWIREADEKREFNQHISILRFFLGRTFRLLEEQYRADHEYEVYGGEWYESDRYDTWVKETKQTLRDVRNVLLKTAHLDNNF